MLKHPLTAAQMEKLCLLLQPLVGWELFYCAGEHPSRFSLVLTKGDTVKSVFFCFDPPFVRFHLSFTPSKKKALSNVNFFLQGGVLKSVEMLNHDRIFKMIFQVNAKEIAFIAELFPKRPNFYLTDSDGAILFSLHHREEKKYQLPPQPSYISTESDDSLNHEEVDSLYRQLELEKEKESLRSFLAQSRKKQLKRIKNLEEALQESSTWEKVLHEAELLKANFGALKRGLPSIVVWDWELNQEKTISLVSTRTPQEELALRFKRSKKLQAGLIHLNKQINQAKEELIGIEENLRILDSLQKESEIEEFKQKIIPPSKIEEVKKSIQTKTLPYYEFISEAGVKIWVGKNAKANDKLTFIHANGADWWMHVQGYPGSHVVIKSNEPDAETVADALQLALLYSKAKKGGEGEICLTQKKFLSRLGKQAGKVQVSKHKSIWIKQDLSRIERIKKRKAQE